MKTYQESTTSGQETTQSFVCGICGIRPETSPHWHPKVEKPIINETKQGRNDPCNCGSGKKYKKCHGLTL